MLTALFCSEREQSVLWWARSKKQVKEEKTENIHVQTHKRPQNRDKNKQKNGANDD